MQSTPPGATQAPVIPVSVLNRLARERLETGFPLCWVAGEVSNLTYAASGHVYFSLKDATAQVRCVMFRNRAQLLGWRLEAGQHIEARVLVTLYEARGDFQLNVETARKAGVGNLYERFLQLKEKLEREGLFAAEAKRPLPPFPRRLGIVTSPQAAALRDVLTTMKRRAPHVDITIFPTLVQGEGAPAQIVTALREADARGECDILILCRGGGSIEDLWAFNDENLARTIRACSTPVVVGVGHETDFTIADFAADLRAPTPTAAAELAAPERSALFSQLASLRAAMKRRLATLVDQRAQQIDWLSRRLQHPAQRLAVQRERLQNLQRRLDNGLVQAGARERTRLAEARRRLQLARPNLVERSHRCATLRLRLALLAQNGLGARTARLAQLADALAHLNPDAVLTRGYSIVMDAAGAIVRDSAALEPNDGIAVFFHRGRATATVTSVTAGAEPATPD